MGLLKTPAACLKFAIDAHGDQVDKQGAPYFYHITRVGSSLYRFGPDFVMAGYLHDVIEDTNITPQDLAELGLPWHIVLAVLSVTKTESERTLEAYEASIRKAMADPIGKWVKAADVSDNASRVGDIPWGPLQARLRAKYEMAERVIGEYIPGYWVGMALCPPSWGSD